MHWPRIRGLCSVSWCLAEGQWNGDQRRPMGSKAREGLYSFTLSIQSYSVTERPPTSAMDRKRSPHDEDVFVVIE